LSKTFEKLSGKSKAAYGDMDIAGGDGSLLAAGASGVSTTKGMLEARILRNTLSPCGGPAWREARHWKAGG